MLTELFMKLAVSSNHHFQLHQLIVQTRKEKKGLVMLQIENKNIFFENILQEIPRNSRNTKNLLYQSSESSNDELSTQQEESKITVNQLLVQIQELQDKVNSLNDEEEFHNPETASSSG